MSTSFVTIGGKEIHTAPERASADARKTPRDMQVTVSLEGGEEYLAALRAREGQPAKHLVPFGVVLGLVCALTLALVLWHRPAE